VKSLGIGPGDEVITTPLSWLATGSSVLLNGATAVFCDIDQTLNIDPGTIERHITARTKAILPVHFTGRLARMPEILEIAGRHNLRVIEDCAQAFGATFDDRPSGSFGDIACMSFNAMKILGGLGDGGLVLTDDDRVAARLRMLRHSGVPEREYCEELSHNCRLDTIQAAVLLRRLPRQPAIIARRRELADRYDRELAGTVQTPPPVRGYADVFYTYTIRTPRREKLRLHLADCGIETRIQHPVLMNDQPAFQGKVRGHSPVAGKTESYHMVFGELDIVLFSDDGRPIRVIPMGTLASGKTHVYRLNAPIWHSVIVRSEYAAIHEVTNGPFNVEENEFAPWAPEEPNALRQFLDRSAETAADLR
jgi:cupin fold WbuC family metalloprotein